MMRNAAVLMAQRAALIGIGFLYAVIIPRLMGAADYGRFGLLSSVMTWFFLLSDLGIPQAMTRQLPERLPGMDLAGRRRWFGSTLAFRWMTGVVVGSLFVATVSAVLRDLPVILIVIFAGVAVVDTMVEPTFTWQLGQNRADRWGMQFLMRRAGYLVFIPLGYFASGLMGAAAAGVLVELIILFVGLRWAGSDFDPRELRIRDEVVMPMLKFGIAFYSGNLITSTYRYSAETVVRLLTHNYAEVGFIGITQNVYMAAEAGFLQLYVAVTPFLSQLQSGGQMQKLREWSARLFAVATMVAATAAFAAWYLSDAVVPRVFGESFRGATPNLRILGFALLAGVANSAAAMLSIVLKRPRIYVISSAARLVAFLLISFWLTPRMGSFGAAVAMALALSIAAVVGVAQIEAAQPFPLRRWMFSLLAAAPWFFLSGRMPAVAAFAVASAGYIATIFIARIIEVREIREAWRAIFHREEKHDHV